MSSDEQTVRLDQKRFARRQWARRWVVWRRALLAVLGVAAVGLVVWLVFFSSLLAVSGVQIEGVSLLSARRVQRVAAVPVGQPLATVDLGAIAARVENLAPVASVDVSRAWPGRIRIAVTERTAVAVVDQGGVVRGMDATGVLFRRYPSRPARLPVVHLAADARAAAREEAAKVVAALPSGLAAKVDSVEVATIDTISLRLHDGRTVHWGSADHSEDKARVVAVLLRHKASTYDVSVPGRPTVG